MPGDKPSGSAIWRLYHGQTNYDFINRWKIWFLLSGTVIVVGLISLLVGGLNFSIDFKGGSVWQVPTNASVATVRADIGRISPLLSQATILQLTDQQTGQKNIKVEASSSITSNTQLVNKVTDELASIAHVPAREVSATLIGPSWGSSISKKAIEAVIVFLVLIALAIAVYFETKMAVGALVALLHDILVTVGIYALSGFQVSPDTVIAFLTVMGYSLYDTIVVFDKVKENTRGLASTNRVTYTDVVNLSMNQVLARSVNTSFVAIMPVFCILVIGAWILGASALNDFGLALFIGLLSGAYSSIFIASPILALLKEREPRYVEIRRRLAAYPQSRQVLTAAMVSGGALVASRPALGRGDERGSQPALTAASGVVVGGYRAERSAAASAASSAGAAAAWAELGEG
ncbi:MAG TPA: protein translocase subunit SecF, partial [Acidimicrobiales bacterium]|nr:protein translocase subunit SecF [Acidimicrobiales bacterium]